MIPLNKPKLDSLRIRVPLSKVQVNNQHSEFLRKLTTVNDDSEIIEEHVKTTYFNPNEIISCSYHIRTFFGGEPLLHIGFSSKLLKEQYFIGINKFNINKCFDFINSEGLISISKEVFLEAEFVDVDFCIDYYLDTNVGTVSEVVSICNDLTKPNKQINVIPYKRKENTGIQWGHRDKVGRSYKNKQFLKYYAKAVELTFNSTDFYDEYLKDSLNDTLIDREGKLISKGNKFFDLNKLIRIETTLKNREHFKSYGYHLKTLKDLLNLDLDIKFLQIFTRPMSVYMSGYREIKHAEKMTINQRTKYLLCLNTAKLNKMSIEDVVPQLAFQLHPNNIRARRELKQQYFNIINMEEVGVKTHKHNKEHWNRFISEIRQKNIIP